MALTHIIDSDYTIQIHKNNKLQYSDIGTQAKTEIAFSLSGPSIGQTIGLKEWSPGPAVTYTAGSTEKLSSQKFNASGTLQQTATSLKNCIEDSDGHDGAISVEIVQEGSKWVLKLTQRRIGTGGNTVVSNGLSNVSVDNFSGGIDTEPPAIVLPFRFDFLGAPNLRGQTTDKKYKTFLGEQKL